MRAFRTASTHASPGIPDTRMRTKSSCSAATVSSWSGGWADAGTVFAAGGECQSQAVIACHHDCSLSGIT